MSEQGKSKAAGGAKSDEVQKATEGSNAGTGALSTGQRWSPARKREVVMRMLRGESVQVLSRELGVEVYRLEKWRDKAHVGIEAALRERGADPGEVELAAALKRIGELTMEVELLRMKADRSAPFGKKRSGR